MLILTNNKLEAFKIHIKQVQDNLDRIPNLITNYDYIEDKTYLSCLLYDVLNYDDWYNFFKRNIIILNKRRADRLFYILNVRKEIKLINILYGPNKKRIYKKEEYIRR